MDTQHTIRRDAHFNGIGLHTGNMCEEAVFKPAPANTGVKLIRTDLPGAQ